MWGTATILAIHGWVHLTVQQSPSPPAYVGVGELRPADASPGSPPHSSPPPVGAMGSKRPRPWSRQPSGNPGSVAVAAAAFALAALALPEARALSGACTGRSDSSRARTWGDNSSSTTCIAERQGGPARRRKALVLSNSSGGGACRAAPSSSSGHVRRVLPPSPPAVLPLVDDHEGGSERNNNRESLRLQGGSAAPSISAVSVAHVLEPPPPRPPPPPARGSAPAPRTAAGSSRAKNSSGGDRESEAIYKVHRWKRDNDVRMFLMERGLSQWEVRKVLPVMRRDPELVNDIATLAARMQVGVRYFERRRLRGGNCSLLPCSLGVRGR